MQQDLTGVSTLQLGLMASEGRLASLHALVPADAVPATTSGGTSFLSGTAMEIYHLDFDAMWRGVQSLSVVGFAPLDDDPIMPRSVSTDLGVGLQRSWPRDAGSADLHANYIHYDSLGIGSGLVPERNELFSTASLTWVHELSRHWRSELGGGIGLAVNLEGSTTVWTPVGHVVVRYGKDVSSLDLTLTHGAQANVLVGQTYLREDAALHAATTLGRNEEWALRATAGYSHGSTIALDETTMLPQANVDVVFGEAAIAWRPSPGFEIELRHDVSYQHSDVVTVVPTYTRNVTMLSLSVAYPKMQGRGLAASPTLQVRATEEQERGDQRVPAAPAP
jgi:hypothetical protein